MKDYLDKIISPNRRRTAAIKTRAFLFGASRERRGFLPSFILYFTVISLALIYVAPLLTMVSNSIKSFADVMNPTTQFFPSKLEWENYKKAFDNLLIWPGTVFVKGTPLYENIRRSTFLNTLAVALPSTALQVLFCSVAGYAFGRMKFPLKRLFFVLLLLEFIVPIQAQLVPLQWTYKTFKLLNTPLVFILPALFGHGLKGALFVFIYTQFFRKLPKELEEAAMMDGVGPLKIYYKIMMPLAKPAYMVVLLFSLVYHWTDSTLTQNLMLNSKTLTTQILVTLDRRNGAVAGTNVNEQTIQMAMGMLFMLPLLIIYFFAQKTFTESIERTGLVE
jgi:multiple sugar transport system permease protein